MHTPPEFAPKLALEHLIELLTLREIDANYFQGSAEDPGWGRLYGGHVLAQALRAAQATVPAERLVHSLHGYFLLGGDVNRPILYQVDRIRDGGTFNTRRVVAYQGGKAIFNLAASFHAEEPGFSHQDAQPAARPADSLVGYEQAYARHRDELPAPLQQVNPHRALAAFDMRPDEPLDNPMQPPAREPSRNVWLRTHGAVPDDPALHAALFAYISDNFLLATSLRPHAVSWMHPKLQIASLDHSLWFHQPLRVDQWLLHAMHSPRAAGARGLATGQLFAADGSLVASSAQEGLIRMH